MKIKLILCAMLISLLSCGGSGDGEGDDGKFNVTFYNSSDAFCAFAQEDIDIYADDKLLFTLAPAEKRSHALSGGNHSVETCFAGTDERIGTLLTFNLTEDTWIWAGCSDGTTAENTGLGSKDPAPVQIKKAEWYVDSLPSGFSCVDSDWNNTQHHMIYLHYENTDSSELKNEDVKAVYFYSYETGLIWTRDSIEVDNLKKRLPGEFAWCYDDVTSDNGSVIPIGRYFGKIQLNDGSVSKYEFTISHPGVTDSDEAFVYSSSFDEAVPDNYVMMLAYPQVTAATLSGSQIEIEFSVEDSRVNDGLVLFYDSEKTYIGQTVRFRTVEDSWSSVCNSGSALKTDGTPNSLVITESDTVFDVDGKSFSDIVYAVVLSINTNGSETCGTDFGFLRSYSDAMSVE